MNGEGAVGGGAFNPVELLVILLLILLNAVFVAAEIAFVTMRRSRLQQLVDEGHSGARRVQRLTSDPSRFLAVIQLAITFIGFLASAFATVSLTVVLRDVFLDLDRTECLASGLALIVVTAVLSFVTIIFGELVPKTLALAHAERYSLLLAGPIDLIGRVLAPVVWLLSRITNSVSRLLGAPAEVRDQMSTEELKLLVERGGEQGILEAEEEQMISAVMELGGRRVHEVMVPRVDMVALPGDAPLGQFVDTIVEAGHSRIPVYEDSIDNIIGVLYAKDLLPYLKGADHAPNIRSLLRTPLFVPESMSIDDLLHSLQRRRVHIAIVGDEYGGTAGLVTIEDLIEEIVGEIQDEYDKTEEPMIETLSDTEARIDGRVSVDDLFEHFELRLNGVAFDEYDTVGGLVYHHLGGVPKVGDTVQTHGVSITVETTDGRRVGKVLAVRRQAGGSEEGAED
ncbi:hemolysin family protein [soil metagenome]